MLPALLAGLDVRGALISLDAASCHPSAARVIVARGADYLIALKGNSRTLHAAARDWFGPRAPSRPTAGCAPARTAWMGATAAPSRRCVFVADAAALPRATELTAAWPGLRRVVAVETKRLVENPAPGAPRGVSREVRYYLTSSAAAETDVAAAVRAHWGIENCLHWVLDTGFGEDLSRVRDRNAAANLAVASTEVVAFWVWAGVAIGRCGRGGVCRLRPEPHEDPTSDDGMALTEARHGADDGDVLRSLAETVLWILMEADVEGRIGAGRLREVGRARRLARRAPRADARRPARPARAAHCEARDRPLLRALPRGQDHHREGAGLCDPRQAWIAGVSTRKLDDLVQAMGLGGLSRSQASELCRETCERVGVFLTRASRPRSVASSGRDVAAARASRRADLRLMRSALATMRPRASTPCSPRRSGPGLRAVQPQGRRRDTAPRGLPAPRPPAEARARLVDEVEHDALACQAFPILTFPIQTFPIQAFPIQHRTTWHGTTWHGTGPLERPNREVKRRADVVGIFPDEGSIVRLIGAVPLEANDEWQPQHRHLQIEGMAELDAPPVDEPAPIATTVAARPWPPHPHQRATPRRRTLPWSEVFDLLAITPLSLSQATVAGAPPSGGGPCSRSVDPSSRHHRPCDARDLVGDRHRDDVRRPPLHQRHEPRRLHATAAPRPPQHRVSARR